MQGRPEQKHYKNSTRGNFYIEIARSWLVGDKSQLLVGCAIARCQARACLELRCDGSSDRAHTFTWVLMMSTSLAVVSWTVFEEQPLRLGISEWSSLIVSLLSDLNLNVVLKKDASEIIFFVRCKNYFSPNNFYNFFQNWKCLKSSSWMSLILNFGL